MSTFEKLKSRIQWRGDATDPTAELDDARARLKIAEQFASDQQRAFEAQLAELRKDNDDLRAELTATAHSLRWIEARAADLRFELKSAQTRLAESQAIRKELETIAAKEQQ
jgi:septal ring factor EnvC (AmiA/AmiB activator)